MYSHDSRTGPTFREATFLGKDCNTGPSNPVVASKWHNTQRNERSMTIALDNVLRDSPSNLHISFSNASMTLYNRSSLRILKKPEKFAEEVKLLTDEEYASKGMVKHCICKEFTAFVLWS